ncbi:sugar transferase [Psychroserpens sp.]|uniref:sugar transferase n=1 Tax=Psychroserpens sp. TaxID=2020870 RepID=UPI001B2BF961|nr:sugar transferase [Psychroserpens sp.]MBO6606487.1 sugar transferase [Psychroserpens sp.]MBO6632460.1 sugar transferase [Psychroserpens sp.]MBO6653191.1 sugar transferase [Psychroserpens sp.]MBO6680781.1 sugar transferase [Psychroserpens sp.]MBO6750261.1 sugar transferase [Psychroserpens sp.]
MYKTVIKPFFDIIIASIGFILLFPLFLSTWIVLLFKNNGKAFFYQERPGKDERIFKIIKFKTMNDKTDSNGALLPPSERLTKAGIFVRKYSLDEIPQLLNVIKGDMSLIGPRPLLIRYLPRYNDFQKQRHNIKPGITGWAQVNGRNAISWEQKFEYDVWYVHHMSLLLDIKILFRTIYKVFKKDGIYSVDNDIVPDFMGTETKESNQNGN